MAKKPDYMAEHRKRERKLAQQLARAPMTVITGIIDARGPGGGRSQGEKLYTLMHAKRLQAPTIHNDAVFGKMKLDRRFNSYEAPAKWNGKRITISIDSGKLENGLKIAHALWKDQAKWKKRVEDFAVAQLLPNKNEIWLEEGEKPLTPEQFKKRMKLESISIYDSGSFAFWHDDGDLFWGHSIQISADLKRGPYDADTPG